MRKKKDLFDELRSKYTLDEIADAFVFPIELTPQQAKEAKAQLTAARKKTQAGMSEKTRVELELLSLKFRIEDYIAKKVFHADHTFGSYLRQYVENLEIKKKQFAADISIDETVLSQLINKHRMPPDYIIIRLEIHSNNIIPAKYWLKLIELQREHELTADKAIRVRENKYVHNAVFAGR